MKALKEEGVDYVGKKMVVIGAGGAATAIEVQAALDGVKELTIFNRDDEFYSHGEETVKKLRERTDCVVNIYHLEDHETLKKELNSADIYIEVGCKNFNGLGMMLYQGAAAFKLWTGKDMPVDFIKDVLF